MPAASSQMLKTGRLNLLATVALLAVGIAMYLGGEQVSGFGRLALQGLGGLIAVAIAGGFVYDIFIRDIHRQQTMLEVEQQLSQALENALTESALSESLASLAMTDRTLTDTLEDRLRAAVREEYTAELERTFPGAFRHGFSEFVDEMRFDKLFESLKRDDELLWLDTYCPDQPSFEQPLREAVKRGAHVRMLAMRPKSKMMALRASEIDEAFEAGYSANNFAGHATTALRAMRDLIETLSREAVLGSVVLRLYDDLPCVPMYLIRRNGHSLEGYTSFFLTRPTYREPHIHWVNGPMSRLDCFVAYFERKWNSSQQNEIAVAGSP